jgi:CHAD domain-containing protein
MLATIPDVMSGKEPEAIHDYRVYTRRLQQALDLLYPKPRPKPVRLVRRTLRRSRRLMTPLRTTDVVLGLVAKHSHAAGHPARRQAWRMTRTRLQALRKREHARACRKLRKIDPMGFMGKARDLLQSTPAGAAADLALGRHAIGLLRQNWQGFIHAVEQGGPDSHPETIHAARIALKKLRYTVELLTERGGPEGKSFLAWMRRLQQGLGDWHDQVDLERALCETLAQPDEIQADLLRARAFLRLIGQTRKRQRRHLERFFARTVHSSERARMQAWVAAMTGESVPGGKSETGEPSEAVAPPQSSS